MEGKYPKILSSQESSTMASTWTEYLRLNKEADGIAVLEICQYQVLAEAHFDDQGHPILPPNIDPKDVVQIEDGYICGGTLTSEYGASFQFTRQTISDAVDWLKDNGWECSTEMLADLNEAVEAAT